MMDERELTKQLEALKESWPAGDPPLDAMWAEVERAAFPVPAHRTGARWIRTILPLAAVLLGGIAIGQLAPPLFRQRTFASAAITPVTPASAGAPFVGVASDYLARVTALLVTLAFESRNGRPIEYSATQARDLLATTRLLMDSPRPLDPQLQALLEDLELVLAQIVRLPARPDAPDVYLIDQALDQRAVLPRLRVMLAEAPTYAP
jgi:hypothetical protein